MNNFIYPCLIIKGKTAEAADFYMDTFGEGKIAQTAPYVIQIELSGQKLMLLNDGPPSIPNPAISFMVISETAEETERYWNKLITGGQVLMPLDSYGWSEKYGWVQDKFNISWQLFTGSRDENQQKFSPMLLFTGANAGRAGEALHFYTELFPESAIQSVMKYAEGEGDRTDLIKHARFSIDGFGAMAMDSSADHHFSFNDSISLVVECDNQDEIDNYWDQLTAGGGQELACGWLTDKYGVSWQIVPKIWSKLIKDPERGQRAMEALWKMKKLIIADLENA